MHNQTCPDWAEALLNGFSQIFLQRHPLCGLLCLLAILIGAPALLGGALLGGVAGLLTAQRRGYPKVERQAGLYSYNGVLLGVLISQHFAWSALLPPLILACGGLSAILTRHWLKHASQPDDLPAYTAPFVGLGWLLLGTVPPSTFAVTESDTLAVLTAPFTGLAQIMLLDQPVAGASIALGLWLANRRACVWALIGASAGMLIALWLQEPASALLGLHGYNPALAALALSQVRRQPWLPLLGLLLAILLTPGFAALHLPALTAPFILACWLVRAGARVLRKPRMDRPFESP
ncbi:urea transporter [Pseudomonas fluorescens group sp.]|uniref:ABC transport system, membrane protein n=2 Tax=Pseudomonas fluorescens TaxID=294 RepID=C3K656_PSEFS|nr:MULTISPECIES: urea transporter [Pseudomonas fluorescens group]MBZ6455038.1 urea transporter [Pseudomonas fluorescens group sp.]MBZ6465522.1 urea transporter [Pseudomonas fluorescens group sp.]MBZ6470459.1 urea transporter [Pseudomonas fluorescens group sp.]WQD74087.1 urea transporter [Pseudomonas marginalis]CAI2796078.1 Putative ABC transport system, membrane protein [Pseudomonas fluorescens SBW25]